MNLGTSASTQMKSSSFSVVDVIPNHTPHADAMVICMIIAYTKVWCAYVYIGSAYFIFIFIFLKFFNDFWEVF